MVELGTRRTAERVRVGHSPPTVARAVILPDGTGVGWMWASEKKFRKAQLSPEKIRLKIKRLIAMPDYPEELVKMVEKAVALS
jgi:hypothetical protein